MASRSAGGVTALSSWRSSGPLSTGCARLDEGASGQEPQPDTPLHASVTATATPERDARNDSLRLGLSPERRVLISMNDELADSAGTLLPAGALRARGAGLRPEACRGQVIGFACSRRAFHAVVRDHRQVAERLARAGRAGGAKLVVPPAGHEIDLGRIPSLAGERFGRGEASAASA